MSDKTKLVGKGMMAGGVIMMVIVVTMIADNRSSIAPTPVLTRNKFLTSPKKEYELCQTEECKRTAASLGSAMDLSMNPCEDFYQFSCGNWISKMKSSSNGSSTNQMQQVGTKVMGKLIELTEAVNENDIEPMKQFKNLYDSCVKAAFAPNGLQFNGTETNDSVNFVEELGAGKVLEGKKAELICIAATSSIMPFAMEQKYGLEHGSKDKLDEARKLVAAVKASFQKFVLRLNWMDDATKGRVILRSELLLTLLGYPERLRNSSEFAEDFYKKLKFYKDDPFIFNVILFSLWKSKNKLVRDQDPIEIQIWRGTGISTLATNAIYHSIYNALIITEGIMEEPFFGTGLKATDYGGLGMVVGHEIVHGFDMAAGSINSVCSENAWWSSTARTSFFNRSDCFVKQYESYRFPELEENKSGEPNRINGTLTLKENLADNAGLQVAYDAYKDYVRGRNKPEPRLPGGLEAYSPEQLFFLSFAHSWCAYETPTDLKERIQKESHSPFKYRVLGALSNFDEFSSVWKCPPTSKMNPENKCVV